MTTYLLWCPDADGTQHTACFNEERINRFPWGTRVPRREEIEAYLLSPIATRRPDLTTAAAVRGFPQPHITFDACHFNRITPETAETRTLHLRDHVPVQASLGDWGHGTDFYPTIRQHYRCAVHGTQPQPFMRAHSFEDRWQPIWRANFGKVHRETTREEQQQMLGEFWDTIRTLGIPYHFRWLRFQYPLRTIETSHDLW